MNKNNEVINVKCVDFTFDGQGLCKANNRVIFVPSLLIDEEAEVEILYRKKNFDVGKIKKITKFSPYRINPLCKCATSCGGCSFQNLDYQKELEYKKKTAINILNSIGKLNIKDVPLFKMETPYFYRNKIQVPFGYDKQHRLVYGFYKIKSHDIVPITKCMIEDEVHEDILKNLARLLKELKIKAYDEDKEEGIVRHALIRVGKVTKEVMLTLVVTTSRFKSKNILSKALVKACPMLTTIVLNINERKTNVILGDKEEVIYGKGYIEDILLGIKFRISSKSFYQVNHDQCEVLYKLASREANLTSNDVILDAYCGIGTIGLTLANKVKEVVGVEIVKEAINDAKLNAKLNNINNVKFYCLDASDFVFNNKFDAVFVDPPRKGLDEKFINALIKSAPKKIIYISCDVSTLARDLFILKKYYDIKSINFVDMFPRTYHVETIVGLSLKN